MVNKLKTLVEVKKAQLDVLTKSKDVDFLGEITTLKTLIIELENILATSSESKKVPATKRISINNKKVLTTAKISGILILSFAIVAIISSF